MKQKGVLGIFFLLLLFGVCVDFYMALPEEEAVFAELAPPELPVSEALTEVVSVPVKTPKEETDLKSSVSEKVPAWIPPTCRSEMTIFEKSFTEEDLNFLNPIPVQIPLEDEDYKRYRENAESKINVKHTVCAKFVNRLFLARFGQPIYGNAWDVQLHEQNKKFLNLVFRLPEDRFLRNQNLALREMDDRVEIFEELYDILDCDSTPVGMLGFLYHFSFEREKLAKNPAVLPQSHLVFLAGRKSFYFENTDKVPQSLEKVIMKKYGKIHDFERDFLLSRVNLDVMLEPNEKYEYQDYLTEEHFRGIKAGSLLEIFLRKHRNNHVTPLLRPVSYSRISDALIFALENQVNDN